MTVVLWLTAGCAAAFFFVSGYGKIQRSRATIGAPNQDVDRELMAVGLKVAGMIECSAALCLIAPLTIDRALWLSVLSALVLVASSAVALTGHLTRRGYSHALASLALASPSGFITYGALRHAANPEEGA